MSNVVVVVVVLSNSLKDTASESRRSVCQLRGNGGKEFGSMAKIALTSGKEKTCSKPFPTGKSVGKGTSDGGFTGAGHTIQPEDMHAVGILAPCHDLLY